MSLFMMISTVYNSVPLLSSLKLFLCVRKRESLPLAKTKYELVTICFYSDDNGTVRAASISGRRQTKFGSSMPSQNRNKRKTADFVVLLTHMESIQETESTSSYCAPSTISLERHTFPLPSVHFSEKSSAPFSIDSNSNKVDNGTETLLLI